MKPCDGDSNPEEGLHPPGLESAWSAEVDRIQDVYAKIESNPGVREVWRPFQRRTVDHHTQQYASMAELMRGIGRLDLSGIRILDVGCRDGRSLRNFLEYGADAAALVGVDIREEALVEARKLAPNIRFELTNGSSLNFPTGSFDLVTQYVCFSSIASPELRERLASEMWRVLAPGGYVFWWDCQTMIPSVTSQSGPLNVRDLFPTQAVTSRRRPPRLQPSQTVGPSALAAVFSSLMDRLGSRPTHVAALIGPKE